MTSRHLQIYDDLGKDIEEAVVLGYNACVLAYGQSGSGKTYTILGTQDAPGLAPRMSAGLLARLQDRYRPDDICASDFSLTLSLVEIYNERVRDLLAPTPCPRPPPAFTRHAVSSAKEAWSLLARGQACRSAAPTPSHAHSSRSHALLTLEVVQPHAHTRSALTQVDLAGSCA
ncbi:kinesin-like protein Klp98A [Scylla paramamosain]|uniref:kinesin-like protein Klp98A n=1 Tax=Scylla paramamosain TaxID=85552 RepID=UPI003082851F